MTDVADLVALADRLAAEWHAGQTDKIGEPYIGHARRVAARLTTPTQKMVGLLHDVCEDTCAASADLVDAGFPPEVVEAVDVLTRRTGESHVEYLTRVAGSPLAATVKRADIADNTDTGRLSGLSDPGVRERLIAKYAHALAVLDELSPQTRP